MELSALHTRFQEVFESEAGRAFFAPGRINLIGEHTDYNGGRVFPCAITQGTYGIARRRQDSLVRCYSLNFEEAGLISFDLSQELVNRPEDSWTNFVKGEVKFLRQAGHTIDQGFDLLVYGNIPNGAGLSSSASLELLVGITLESLFDLTLTRLDLVKIGQQVENHFIGVNSGIMDQFAIAMGKKDHAILLDCNTLKYDYVPVVLKDEVIVIANTNKRRGLADSKYNERRAECDEALAELQTKLPIKALGELSIEEFEANKDLIKSPIRQKRAKHAVYENQRTLKAQKELSAGNLAEFGKLMNQSHISLRDDYEVTGVELDTLAALAWEQPGVVGSRMTGAGFGGCTVSIVKKDKVDDFIKNVGEAYKNKIGYAADFYIAAVSEGARKL